MEQFLIVCPLVFLAGLVDSIAGGGGLVSLPAYLIAGVPSHMALGTNKLSSFIGTTISTARFAKNGYIRWKLGLFCAAAAIAGSTIGSNLSLLIPEGAFKTMMIVVLPVVAFYVLKNKKMGDDELTGTIPQGKMHAIALCASFVLGGYDGFYGPGTGTFLLLLLTGAAKLPMREAAGLTKIINLASNTTAFVVFLMNGKVLYLLGLVAAVFSVAGHYIGAGLVLNNGQKIVRPVVIAVLAILFVTLLAGR